MVNSFVKTAAAEMNPIFKNAGGKITVVTPTKISFAFSQIIVSFYFEREFEVYSNISIEELEQSVSLSEIMSDYYDINVVSAPQVSERFPLELCMKKLADLMTIYIFPLISNGKIYEAIDTVMLKRKEKLLKYTENLFEEKAKKAFMEKRYTDVISYYEQISELNNIQKKRLEISKHNL